MAAPQSLGQQDKHQPFIVFLGLSRCLLRDITEEIWVLLFLSITQQGKALDLMSSKMGYLSARREESESRSLWDYHGMRMAWPEEPGCKSANITS